MTLRKFLLAILAILGVYCAAAGVLGGSSSFEQVGRKALAPLASMSSADMLLLLGSLVLLGFCLVPNHKLDPLRRTTLLRGVSLGSAALAATWFALLIMSWRGISDPLLGTLALVSAMQALVGLCAASLMLLESDSRRYALAPVCVNSGLTILCGAVVTVPYF
jgi:hypothetical protein